MRGRLLRLAIAFCAFLPVLYFALRSFAFGWYWPALLPREWSGRGWTYALHSASLHEAFAASATIALSVAALSVAIATPAARAIALHEFRGKRAVVFGILLPVLAPPLASAMGVHSLFLRNGFADSIAGVVLGHLIPCAPYCTLVITSAFMRFDPEQESAARTLGASSWNVWRYVTVPAIAPGIAVAAALAFLISWSQYLLTLLLGGGNVRTLPVYLLAFQRSGDETVSAVLTLLFIAPALLVFACIARLLRDNR